jgi:ABC-type cobalamin/Fe3+-siderophores transport system ATPase subunit
LTFKNRPQVVEPIDSHAQSYVARKMAQVADEKRPKFVINVGDVVEMG